MIYLHKILPLFTSPLFLVIFLFILGIIFKSRKISLLGILILVFLSLPIISFKLSSYLEKDYAPQDTSDVDKADAIVVLSGMVTAVKVKDKYKYEFGGAIDRILAGIKLYEDSKASLLILTNGKVPWSYGIPEGQVLKDFAVELGVPEENILLTNEVQNTDQEAKFVKKLLKSNETKVILVTSAFHMPRAKKVFEAAKIKIIPFAVDFMPSRKISLIDFIPSADGFGGTSFFVREMIGRLYYNIKY